MEVYRCILKLKWYADYSDVCCSQSSSDIACRCTSIMGPKRSENVAKGNKSSQSTAAALSATAASGTAVEQGNYIFSSLTSPEMDEPSLAEQQQQCTGKFAADFELCCREPPPGYPVPIAVVIRGHSLPTSSQAQSNSAQSQQQPPQQSGTFSGMSVTPSVTAGVGEEQHSSTGKKTSRSRLLSAAPSGIVIGVTGADSDSRPGSVLGRLL